MRKVFFLILFAALFSVSNTILAQSYFGAFYKTYDVQHLTHGSGISQCVVLDIFQDSNGFIWFATKDGLNRYDGKDIVIFAYDHKDTNSISNSHVLSIEEDKQGLLYVGTNGGGINIFDPETEQFRVLELKAVHSYHRHVNVIHKLKIINDSLLYVGTIGKGMFIINLNNGAQKNYVHIKGDSTSIPGNTVLDIVISPKGSIYVACDINGAARFDPQKGTFEQIYKPGNLHIENTEGFCSSLAMQEEVLWMGIIGRSLMKYNPENDKLTSYHARNFPVREMLPTSFLRDIIVKDDKVWCATQGFGLLIFDPEKESFELFSTYSQNHEFKIYNGLTNLYKDNENGVWTGSNGNGVFYISEKSKNFITFNQQDFKSNVDDPHPSVRGIYRQGDSLWITTYDGIRLYDLKTRDFQVFMEDKDVFSIVPDPQRPEILWLADEGDGLQAMNRLSLKVENIPSTNIPEEGKIYGRVVYSLLHDGDYLWVGTYYGLNRYNKKTGEIKHYIHQADDNTSINFGGIVSMFKANEHELWIGSDAGGIGVLDKRTDKFRRYVHHVGESGTISNNDIHHIMRDSKGRIWVSTAGGLNRFLGEDKGFSLYTKRDGLPNNVVYAALEDERGNLWLSTNVGLSRFNPEAESFRNFDVLDGLQDNEFNTGAYFKTKDGQMIFGGIRGFTMFYPSEITMNNTVPRVTLTYLTLKNQPGTRKIPITNEKEIRLSYKQNIFDIGFVALNYYKPAKNKYRYRISTSDSKTTNWIELGNNNKISFFGLDPGVYNIQVTGSNNDGVWNPSGKTIRLIITPPFWKTDWFIIGLILIFGVMVIMFFILRLRLIRRQRDKLSRLVSSRTRELEESNESLSHEIQERKNVEVQLLQANKTKDKFFSIIGHDLKNPLASQLSLAQLLHEDYDSMDDEDRRNFINHILQSSEKVFKLSENILNWARSQTGMLTTEPEIIILNDILQEVVLLYKSQLAAKNITLEQDLEEQLKVYADPNLIAAVMRNLISNAYKFTPRGGYIKLSARKSDGTAEIKISDTGIGMNKDTLNKLFQVDAGSVNYGTENETGTGLGMLICKEFIDASNGNIIVHSKPGEGTTIVIYLPLNQQS